VPEVDKTPLLLLLTFTFAREAHSNMLLLVYQEGIWPTKYVPSTHPLA